MDTGFIGHKEMALAAVPAQGFAFGYAHVAGGGAVTQAGGISDEGMDDGLGEAAVLPRHVHLEAAAGAEALHAAVRPGLGQGGEQLDFALAASPLRRN